VKEGLAAPGSKGSLPGASRNDAFDSAAMRKLGAARAFIGTDPLAF
jgi:hypothetical protein